MLVAMSALRWSVLLSCFALLVSRLPTQESAEEEYRLLLESAQDKLLQGQLTASLADFEELFDILVEDEVGEVHPLRVAADVGLLEIELRRGNYEQVSEAIASWSTERRAPRAVALLHAEALRRVGRYSDAARLLEPLVAADARDLEARYRLADVLAADGQRQAARKLWQANVDQPAPADGLQLAYLGSSLFRLGGRDNLQLASRRLVESLRAAPKRPEARITYGLLKFAAYGEANGFRSGEQDLNKVLRQNGDDEAALIAMYRVRSANMLLDAGKTEQFLTRALERNPRSVEAIVLRGASTLDDRRYRAAAKLLDEGLAINPNHRAALCHRATVAMLLREDDRYRELRQQALAGDPGWPDLDRTIGDHLVALYRFADAIPFYQAALAADEADVATLSGMAKALIYTGQGQRARELLEQAKQLTPGIVDPWRNNALAVQELLDSEYVVVEQGDFELRLHRDDAEVLQAYLLPIQLEAAETLGAKYQWRPEGKTRIEVLHTWDDFSVRTIGFRGFTALGACFGRLITLVSPVDGDLRRQTFMWEATAWHEYTHVLTLGLSNNRVPRWLTEGFSVFEERERDAAWERGMDRDLFDAFHNQDIPPIHLLNRLFRGPRILFAYFQGGLIIDLINQRYGFDKAIALLRAFGDDLDTEAAFQRALGMSSRDFDRELLEFIERDKLRGMKLVPRFNPTAIQRLTVKAARDKSDLQSRVHLAWAAMQRDNPVDAGRWLAEVLRVDPEHGQGLLVRAEMFRRRGELDAAIDHWQRGFAAGADDFDSRIAFGDTLLANGDAQGAIDQWQRAKACWPKCTEQANAPELRLARLYREQGEQTQAQMEMKAFCRRTARAFQPRYTLAEFEREAGNRSTELRFLQECNRIDPFYRELHVRLGEAYQALDKIPQAALEFEVAAAVKPDSDRAYMARGSTPPAADDPREVEAKADLWLRAARLRHQLGDQERASQLLARILGEANGTDAADEARQLEQEWRGR